MSVFAEFLATYFEYTTNDDQRDIGNQFFFKFQVFLNANSTFRANLGLTILTKDLNMAAISFSPL